MGHALGLRVTAEFVENAQTMDLLKNMRCGPFLGLSHQPSGDVAVSSSCVIHNAKWPTMQGVLRSQITDQRRRQNEATAI